MPIGVIIAWGVICLVVSGAAVIGGIVLLARSAKLPAGAKGKVIRLIIGLILVANGVGFALVSVLFIFSSDWISKAPTAADTAAMVTGIQDSLEDNDPDELAALFATEGYSGATLDESDATQMFGSMDGNVTDTQFTVTSTSFEGNTHANSFEFIVTTDTSNEYTICFDFILASDNEDYKGIQHIEMSSEGQVLFEAGAAPELETSS